MKAAVAAKTWLILSQDPVAVASPDVKEADQQQEEEVESAEVHSCKKITSWFWFLQQDLHTDSGSRNIPMLILAKTFKIFAWLRTFFSQIDSCDSDSKPAEESDSGVELDEEEKADEEEGEEEEGVEDDTENADPAVECENSNNGGDGEVDDNKADEDDANRNIVEDEDLGVGDTGDESETDTEDFTDSEDDTVEYMDDGEPVRKCKRGFKILQNCKRFWKASYDWVSHSE